MHLCWRLGDAGKQPGIPIVGTNLDLDHPAWVVPDIVSGGQARNLGHLGLSYPRTDGDADDRGLLVLYLIYFTSSALSSGKSKFPSPGAIPT